MKFHLFNNYGKLWEDWHRSKICYLVIQIKPQNKKKMETQGKLEKLFNKIADNYEVYMEYRLKIRNKGVEPHSMLYTHRHEIRHGFFLWFLAIFFGCAFGIIYLPNSITILKANGFGFGSILLIPTLITLFIQFIYVRHIIKKAKKMSCQEK